MKIISRTPKSVWVEDPRISTKECMTKGFEEFKKTLRETESGVRTFIRPSAWLEETTKEDNMQVSELRNTIKEKLESLAVRLVINNEIYMDMGEALMFLNRGQKVARSGWNGKGMFIELQVPDKDSKMTLPYIWMSTACGNKVPWLASQTDLLATDWTIVE